MTSGDHAAPPANSLSYRAAGVDIEAGDALVEAIKPHAKATTRAGVLGYKLIQCRGFSRRDTHHGPSCVQSLGAGAPQPTQSDHRHLQFPHRVSCVCQARDNDGKPCLDPTPNRASQR